MNHFEAFYLVFGTLGSTFLTLGFAAGALDSWDFDKSGFFSRRNGELFIGVFLIAIGVMATIGMANATIKVIFP